MSSATILTGCPGTGKTTLASLLAGTLEQAVVVDVDRFFDFVCTPISPVLKESHNQNATVMHAVATAAAAYAGGGYNVIVEGVVGPWFVPVFVDVFRPLRIPLDYIVLRAPLDHTVHRATTRSDAAKFGVAGVRHMHDAFADLRDYAAHAQDTAGLPPGDVLQRIIDRRARGEFRLNVSGSGVR